MNHERELLNVVQIDLANKKEVQEFLALPYRIYRDIPQWVPPLQADERQRLKLEQYPYYRHSNAAFFIARQNGQAVGRLAILDPCKYNTWNNEETAFFYLFECDNDREAASELFRKGLEWARKRGLKMVIGPKGFTALDGLGLLVKGFEHRPALGQPFNPAYYPPLIEAQGFKKVNEIVSGYMCAGTQFPKRIHALSALIQKRRGFRIARFHSRRELRAALSQLKSLYNGALGGTNGVAPITEEEIKNMADQMLWFADPNLIKIVMMNKRPVGFLLAYPDISAALQRTKGRLFPFGWIKVLREVRTTDWININGAGIIEEYRGLGGTAILYSEMFKSVEENPRYRHIEVVQIGMDNDKMKRELENFGVDFYKIHGMYQKNL